MPLAKGKIPAHKVAMGETATKRLDELLVQLGHYATRARARDAIVRGCVTVDGRTTAKPGAKLPPRVSIKIDDPAAGLVSRAALKLRHGLAVTNYSLEGRVVADLGASTGGFTQVALEAGAAKVFAIDVGHGQLAPGIAVNPKVVSIEGLNARDLALEDLDGQPPSAIVCDVSFISLKLALPPTLRLADTGAVGIFLFKPQFEVGKENIGRGGLVRDAGMASAAARTMYDWLDAFPGWEAQFLEPSPITGSGGNIEYLIGGRKTG